MMKMKKRTKAERRARARKVFRAILGVLTLGIVPLLQSRGGKARKAGNAIGKGADVAGDVLDGTE